MGNPRAEFAAEPLRYAVNGTGDDLLSAGLGPEGLRGPPPAFADPLHPTWPERRRRAIYMNYRNLVDVTAAGGFGSLFGPAGRGIAGVEYLVGIRTPDGRGITTALLQIPESFDPANPRLIAVASSGSRGIFGALPTAGEWGLRNGCAVVHTDKGTGTGIFDVSCNKGVRIDGAIADAGDPLLSFSPPAADVAALREQRPHGVLFKHPHSGLNVEAQWGEYLLQAIDAAFQLLNREYSSRASAGQAFRPDNTLIVASGISNGGATALRAVERDEEGWIDGVVVSEPNVTVAGLTEGVTIRCGTAAYTHIGASLYDFVTEHMLLQPCAVLAETDSSAPSYAATQAARPALERWCREMRAQGLLCAKEVPGQAREARDRLLNGGILPEALRLGHMNVQVSLWTDLAITYAAAYARMSAAELPCGVSFAPTDETGAARALTDEELARLFCDSSGIPRTAGIVPVVPSANGAAVIIRQDDTALATCLRSLQAKSKSGANDIAGRLAQGQRETRMTARLRGRPAIVLHGRADGLVAVNHTSRAYYALNRREESAGSKLRYYEVEHGQHFDSFLALPGFTGHHVPIQPLLLQAMDLMMAHLRGGAALPPSQVVRTKPRARSGNSYAPLSRSNLGGIHPHPGSDVIGFSGSSLHIP